MLYLHYNTFPIDKRTNRLEVSFILFKSYYLNVMHTLLFMFRIILN
nr:MAG TPA: hypothetical protein [Caudoviricetes sp.]